MGRRITLELPDHLVGRLDDRAALRLSVHLRQPGVPEDARLDHVDQGAARAVAERGELRRVA